MKIPPCSAKSSQAVAFANNRLAAAVGLCGLLGAGPALAADRTWTGGGTNDNTNVAANWGGTLPIANDRLVYAGSNRRTPFNDLSSGTNFSGIRFNATAGAFTVSGGSLRLSGAIDFSGNPSAPITQAITHGLFLVNTLTVTTQANGAFTLGGVIGDGGSLRILAKTGDGTLTLSGLNLFGGQAQLGGGTVKINSLANAGTASSLGLGSGVPIILIGSGVSNATLVYTGTAAASTNRQVQVGFGSANSEAGGAGIVNNLADPAHSLTFSNAVFNAANTTATAGRTLTLDGSNTGLNTVSGAIVNNAAPAPIGLTKAGSGTWLLSGASSYTGPTTVSGGILRVSGSLGNTAMTVASGATLSGSGVIGTTGALNTLTVNGSMAPGPSTGVLTVNDNLDLHGTLAAELNGTSAGTGYDQVVVNGAVDVTGSSLNRVFGFTPVNGNILFLVVNDGTDAVTGTFTGLPQNEILESLGGLDGLAWRISYTADAAGGAFTGGNDIALMAVSDGSVVLSSWTFDAGAAPIERLASSGTAPGLTVSRLSFHPTFDALPALVDNDAAPLIALSTHDRWAADSGIGGIGGIGGIRIRRADYLSQPGRTATFNAADTSVSTAAATPGAPVWFSISTDSLTNATIRRVSIVDPGGGDATTYYFSKSGDPLGTGISDPQPIVSLTAPVTLSANQTVYFAINMDSSTVATNHNIARIDLLGSSEALPPPPSTIGLVTGTLTVGPPHGDFNRLSMTVTPDGLAASTDTSDLTGTIDVTVNIDPETGKTSLLTLSDGEVATGSEMNFSDAGYDIDAAGLSATVNTVTPPGSVNPDTGVFAASHHEFEVDQGVFGGAVDGQSFTLFLAAAPLSGLGVGNGSLTLTPAGSSGPYNLFDAVVILPIAFSDSISSSGVTTAVTGSGTIKATGQLQMPSSEFNAWMIEQGATSFDPAADTSGKGAPDGIKWALGLSSLDDNPLPFLLKPVPLAPGTFTITLPPGGTVAPLTVESSSNLQSPWTPVPAGAISSGVNPIPAGSTGQIGVTPAATDRIFLRLRSDP